MFKKYNKRRKKKDGLSFKHKPLLRMKTKKLKTPIIFIQLPLLSFNTTEMNRIEIRNVLIIHRKLCALGYLLDKKTISLFVVGKKTHAYQCIQTFLSYYIKNNKLLSEKSIINAVLSKILHAIGQQYDGSLILEMVERYLDMRTLSVHAITHTILVNICHYITYKILKKGISFIRDFSGYRIRFWNDHKLFLSTQMIHIIFPVVMVVVVDPPFQMKIILRSFLSTTSTKKVTFLYAVKRHVTLESNKSQHTLWNDIELVVKRLPELDEKFPNMRLSKIFGGTDDHLLKVVSAVKCAVTSIYFKCGGDLNHAGTSSNKMS